MRRTDLTEKREAYLSLPSLAVILFVDLERVWVRVDRRGADGEFSQEVYTSADQVIFLPEIEAQLEVQESYREIALQGASVE